MTTNRAPVILFQRVPRDWSRRNLFRRTELRDIQSTTLNGFPLDWRRATVERILNKLAKLTDVARINQFPGDSPFRGNVRSSEIRGKQRNTLVLCCVKSAGVNLSFLRGGKEEREGGNSLQPISDWIVKDIPGDIPGRAREILTVWGQFTD